MSQRELPFLILTTFILSVFGALYYTPTNYELMAHIGMIAGFTILILMTNKRVRYPRVILAGLTLWAFMHLAGSNMILDGVPLYARIIFPISRALSIIRYDQIVHAIGFGFATALLYHLITPRIKESARRSPIVFGIIALAGVGVGAINEMVEFVMTTIFPGAAIGGYENTILDLFGDFVGAAAAVAIIRLMESKI